MYAASFFLNVLHKNIHDKNANEAIGKHKIENMAKHGPNMYFSLNLLLLLAGIILLIVGIER